MRVKWTTALQYIHYVFTMSYFSFCREQFQTSGCTFISHNDVLLCMYKKFYKLISFAFNTKSDVPLAIECKIRPLCITVA